MRTAKTLIRLADAQADLSLRCTHIHFVGFVMRRLICTLANSGLLIARECRGSDLYTGHVLMFVLNVYGLKRAPKMYKWVFPLFSIPLPLRRRDASQTSFYHAHLFHVKCRNLKLASGCIFCWEL